MMAIWKCEVRRRLPAFFFYLRTGDFLLCDVAPGFFRVPEVLALFLFLEEEFFRVPFFALPCFFRASSEAGLFCVAGFFCVEQGCQEKHRRVLGGCPNQ